MAAVQISSRTGRVVVSGYSPSVTQLLGSNGNAGGENTVTISGAYPFQDWAIVTVAQRTDLTLRVPCWTDGATVAASDANEHEEIEEAASCAFHDITLAAGTSVNITFRYNPEFELQVRVRVRKLGERGRELGLGLGLGLGFGLGTTLNSNPKAGLTLALLLNLILILLISYP